MQMSSRKKQNCSRPLQAAIIGCGWVAGGYDHVSGEPGIRTHAKAYALDERTELAAVCDRDNDRLQAFSQAWGVERCYTDAREMLQQVSPDIVSICAADESHYDLLEVCLDYPSVRGVWCEKPLAKHPEGCAVLLERYRESGVMLLVNYMRSFCTDYLKLKEKLLGGEFGKIQKICIYYTKGIMHNGSHAMDLLLDWFGEPDSWHVIHAVVDYNPADPTVDAYLNIHGIQVYFLGLDESKFSFFEMEIYTDNARISLEESGRRFVIRKVSGTQASGHKYLGQVEESMTNLGSVMVDALSCLIDAVDHGYVEINGNRALKGLEITSNMANSWIQVKS